MLLDDGVQLFGNDAWFHLRRVAWSLAHFPAFPGVDPYVDFPHGARPAAAPLFDWLMAALARPWLGGAGEIALARLERWIVWVPPLLGAATVVAVWGTAARHFGRRPAWVAGLVLALLSGHVWYTQVGFVDHHAAVGLVATLLLASGLSLAAAHRERRHRAALLHASLAGGVTAAALLLWPGSLLHIALVDACLIALLLAERNRADACRLAANLAWLHALACGLVAPFAWGNEWPHWGRFAPAALSDFQPWLLGGVALSLTGAGWIWRRSRLGETRRSRQLSLLALALGWLGLSAIALPDMLAATAQIRAWLSRDEGFMLYRSIGEARPLLFERGHLDLRIASVRLTPFVFVLPLAVAAIAWEARRRTDRVAVSTVGTFALGLLGAALFQRRFMSSLAVALALVLAIGVEALWRRLPPARWARRVAAMGIAVGIGGLLAPAIGAQHPHLSNLAAASRDAPLHLDPVHLKARVAAETARWMRAYTPSPGGWLERDARPSYGVLAPWNRGHLIKYLARRPVVADNSGADVGGQGLADVARAFLGDESTALGILDTRRIRYVVHEAGVEALPEAPGPDSLVRRLGELSDLAQPELRSGRLRPGLTRLRLVFESSGVPGHDPGAPPLFRIYEVVPGVRIVGRAEPGSEVRGSLRLVTNRDRPLRYTTHERADAAGVYRLYVPYATEGSPPGVVPARHYRVRSGAQLGTVSVPEPMLRTGADIPGPDLRTGAGASPSEKHRMVR